VWIDGMTQAEAAQVIGVSAVTVKRWLSRGLRLVTERLADFRPVGPPLGRPNNLLAADRPHCGCEEWEVESP
jgi:hypothetical protein